MNVATEHPELVEELLGLMEDNRVESECFSFTASQN